MTHRAWTLLLPLLVSVVSLAGCDKASPVAPSGTILTVSANPSQVSLNGQSTITVVGRKPDGNPLNPGTEIRFSAERGLIEPIVETSDGGVASAVFRADGRAGAVKITVRTGSGDTMAEISVQVGRSTEDKPTVIVNANPSAIPVGGTSRITVIGRNSDGSPAAGERATLTTSLGNLTNSFLTLGVDGTGETTLTAPPNQSGTAKISVILGSSDVATADVEIRDFILTLTANPTTITEDGGTIELNATVNTFQGTGVPGRTVTFQSERGTLNQSQRQTGTNGVATVTLTVPEENLTADLRFQVTATTPSSSGELLTATVSITITDVR